MCFITDWKTLILICYWPHRPLLYKVNLAETRYIYKHYKCYSVYFSWFSKCLVNQLPENGAIALKYVGGLMNYTNVYTVCAFVGLKKI
jgi:hypothetical protein